MIFPEHVFFFLLISILYVGELFQQARSKVRDKGHKFKKGFSRSSQGSSGSSSEGKQSDDGKTEKKESKRKNVLAEERRQAIATNQALLKSTEDHIRLKQLRISKLKTMSDFKRSDEVSAELRKLFKEKGRIESQLTVLQRKESKSHWYMKKKYKRSKTSGVTSEGDLSSLRTLPELLRQQSSRSDSSSKDSDESGDTIILEDNDPGCKPHSQKQTLHQETSSNSEGDSETPDSSQGFQLTPLILHAM